MFQYLENLRRKPEPERRKVVLWISIGATGLIFIIWAVALGMRMKAGDFTFRNSSASSTVPAIGDAFSSFWSQVKGSFESSTTGQ